MQKEITWQQGGEERRAVVFVRPLSYHSTVAELLTASSTASAVAGRISACICDATGNPIFTVADITGEADPERGPLSGELTVALLAGIAEVNGLGKTEPEAT